MRARKDQCGAEPGDRAGSQLRSYKERYGGRVERPAGMQYATDQAIDGMGMLVTTLI
jgi:hypothetical protein